MHIVGSQVGVSCLGDLYQLGQKSRGGLTWVRSGCQQGCVPSGSFRGESVSWPFPASRGHPHSSTLPAFYSQPSGPVESFSCLIALTSAVVISSSGSDTLASLSPFKDLCDYFGPTQVIQDYPPRLNILNFIMSAKSLLPFKVTYSQVQGLRCGRLAGEHYSAYHMNCSFLRCDFWSVSLFSSQ